MITPSPIFLIVDSAGDSISDFFYATRKEANDCVRDNHVANIPVTVVKFVADVPRAKRAKR